MHDFARWTRDERDAFTLLAPIFANLPDEPSWAPIDREALVSLMRAKALVQERTFALRSTRAPRAWKSLTCTSSRDRGTPGA